VGYRDRPIMGLSRLEEALVERDRRLVTAHGLLAFGTLAWPVLFPGQAYVHGWHIEEICKHTEAAYFGDGYEMILNVPPGTGKSVWVSTLADAWAWTVDPTFSPLNFSFDEDNLERDAARVITLVQSPWYQARWPNIQLQKKDPATKFFYNTLGGFRYASTVHGRGTGKHGNVRKCDDPIKPNDTVGAAATTKAELDFVSNWWDVTISTRTKPTEIPRYLVIMQRLHEADLVGHLIDIGRPTVLRLPMRYEADKPCVTPYGGDWRTVNGELLWPAAYPEAKVAKLEAALGIFANAQLQQNPTNPLGEVFKAETFRRWAKIPDLSNTILSVDCSFKDKAGCDNISIQVWGTDGVDFYGPLANVTCLAGCDDTIRLCKGVLQAWPGVRDKLVEDKANGSAVIEALKRAVPGVIEVNPEGGKIARANSITYLFKGGNVYFPPDDYAPWVGAFVTEVLGFPKAKHDDQVDAMTQALGYLAANLSTMWAYLSAQMKVERPVVEPEFQSPFDRGPRLVY
jgi:predicted phage terminase large subunit-like protein